MPADPPTVQVRTLLCQRDLPLFLRCWATLTACSTETVETVVHDDGSLSSEDGAAVCATIPRSRILWRREADQLMADRLRNHLHAARFRASSVWGLKLLDVVVAEAGDCYYVDADVRFFRPFTGLFHASAIAEGPVFLRDVVWTAYSVRPWHLLDRRRLQLCEPINTGLTLVARHHYDLDFVNWFLGQPDWRVIPAWTEPTCWAALAARSGGQAIDQQQLPNLYPGTRIRSDAIGAHFLSAYRPNFARELATALRRDAPPQPVRRRRLGRTGPVALAANQLKRKVSNEWKRFTS